MQFQKCLKYNSIICNINIELAIFYCIYFIDVSKVSHKTCLVPSVNENSGLWSENGVTRERARVPHGAPDLDLWQGTDAAAAISRTQRARITADYRPAITAASPPRSRDAPRHTPEQKPNTDLSYVHKNLTITWQLIRIDCKHSIDK